GPLEIKRIDERLAQAPVLELFSPQIHEPPLGAGRRSVRNHRPLDAAILERRETVARSPGSRGEFLTEQITLCGEAFEPDFAVAIVFVAYDVEIIQPARNGQIGAPPVLDPIEFDGMSDLKAPDLIRATAKRNFQRRLIERLLGIIGSGENRE